MPLKCELVRIVENWRPNAHSTGACRRESAWFDSQFDNDRFGYAFAHTAGTPLALLPSPQRIDRLLAPGIRSSWIPPVPKTAGRQPSPALSRYDEVVCAGSGAILGYAYNFVNTQIRHS